MDPVNIGTKVYHASTAGKLGTREFIEKGPAEEFNETPRRETPETDRMRECKKRILEERGVGKDSSESAHNAHRQLRKSLISNMTAVVAGVVLAIIVDRATSR